MARLNLLACFACLIAGVGLASADTSTFVVNDKGRFGTLDLDTGGFTPIGQKRPVAYAGIGNLADGTLVAVDANNDFLQIDADTGAVTVIGSTGIVAVISASLLTGEQYVLDYQNNLYQLDPDSGAAALVGATGLPAIDTTQYFANAFAGDDAGNLYYVFEQTGPNAVPSTLFQLDPTTGEAAVIGFTGVTGLAGAGFVDGTLYAYGADHHIYTVDVTTGEATDTGVVSPSNFTVYGSTQGGAP